MGLGHHLGQVKPMRQSDYLLYFVFHWIFVDTHVIISKCNNWRLFPKIKKKKTKNNNKWFLIWKQKQWLHLWCCATDKTGVATAIITHFALLRHHCFYLPSPIKRIITVIMQWLDLLVENFASYFYLCFESVTLKFTSQFSPCLPPF